MHFTQGAKEKSTFKATLRIHLGFDTYNSRQPRFSIDITNRISRMNLENSLTGSDRPSMGGTFDDGLDFSCFEPRSAIQEPKISRIH